MSNKKKPPDLLNPCDDDDERNQMGLKNHGILSIQRSEQLSSNSNSNKNVATVGNTY